MEFLGIIGGALFFYSWILQAWETKRAGKSTVSFRFFLIRLLASIILLGESIRVDSIGLTLVYGGTIIMVLYNLSIISKSAKFIK